jgi:hypothetical protein
MQAPGVGEAAGVFSRPVAVARKKLNMSERFEQSPACEWLAGKDEWAVIPTVEKDRLLIAVAEAVDLAEGGRAEAGYGLLLAALQNAQEHWNGDPWGGELVTCYQGVIEQYGRAYAPNVDERRGR